MAITTMDGLIAGFQGPIPFEKVGATMEAAGVYHSLFYTSGVPGAAVAPTSSIAGDALTSYAGQLPYANPVSGNGYLGRIGGAGTALGRLLLCDRLWHNASISKTTTTGQTVTSATLPARDADGSTNGKGVLVGIEVSTATTNATAITNTTLTYTNSDGTGSRTGTISSFPATAVAGTFVPFQLAAGDIGVRSIQTLTLGTSYASSGSPEIHLVAYRILADLGGSNANQQVTLDFAKVGMPRLYDNTVPFLLWQPSATTAVTVRGSLSFAHG
jgi:hypothetical protein